MEKTAKPTVAGVFNIITSILGIFLAITFFIGFMVVGGGWDIPGTGPGYIPNFVSGIVLGWGIITLIAAVLALIGGIFAVQRKQWGWALAGSIAAIFPLVILGIPAVVLIVVSKGEFV